MNSSQLNPLSPRSFFFSFSGVVLSPRCRPEQCKLPAAPPARAGNRRPAIWGNKDINLALPLNKRVWLGSRPQMGPFSPSATGFLKASPTSAAPLDLAGWWEPLWWGWVWSEAPGQQQAHVYPLALLGTPICHAPPLPFPWGRPRAVG